MRNALLLVCLFLVHFPAFAEDRTTSQTEFIRAFIQAVNAKDMEARKAVIHPESRACMTPETAAFYKEVLLRQFAHPIPENYKPTSTPIGADTPLFMEELFEYPVRPSHVLNIEFKDSPTSSYSFVLHMVETEGQWLEVMPCPEPQVIEAFNKQHAEKLKKEPL